MAFPEDNGPFLDTPDGPGVDDLRFQWGPPPPILVTGGLPAPPSTDPEDNPTDLQAQAAGRVLAQYQNSPKLLSFISALIAPLQQVESALTQIPSLDDVDVAGGVNLDVTGDLVGQARQLVNGAKPLDPQYRLMIKARIVRNHSHATGEDLISALTTLFPGAPVVVYEFGDMSAGYAVGRVLSADDVALLSGPELLPRPMGVTFSLRSFFDPTSYFGFAEDRNASDMADDSVSPQVGGGLLAVDF